MKIDSTHRGWFWATLVIFIVSAIAYVELSAGSPGGARGGSGIGGYGMMLYAGLLGARKKVPIWRIGRGQTWMRGHLWFGLLSLPMILFHAGFHFGGPLTTVLMVLLIIVVASGVFGAL